MTNVANRAALCAVVGLLILPLLIWIDIILVIEFGWKALVLHWISFGLVNVNRKMVRWYQS